MSFCAGNKHPPEYIYIDAVKGHQCHGHAIGGTRDWKKPCRSCIVVESIKSRDI